MANHVGVRAASAFSLSRDLTPGSSSGAAEAAAPGSMDIDGVSKALDWWEKKAVGIDEECHRLSVEGTRCVTDFYCGSRRCTVTRDGTVSGYPSHPFSW